jgi:hypothetical protein
VKPAGSALTGPRRKDRRKVSLFLSVSVSGGGESTSPLHPELLDEPRTSTTPISAGLSVNRVAAGYILSSETDKEE